MPAELKVVEKQQLVPEKVWGKRNGSEMRIMEGKIRISEVIIRHDRDYFSKAEQAEGCKD